MNGLIPEAWAQGAPAAPGPGGSPYSFIFMMVAFVIIFYFMLIRPQQKKQKEHRGMLENLRRGDRVVTGGGIIGTVNRVVSAEEVEVDIASGTRVRVVRSTITNVLAKPDPAAAREAATTRERRPRGSKSTANQPAANEAKSEDAETPPS